MLRRRRVAPNGGDGIGPDGVEAGRRVLKAIAEADDTCRFDFENFDWRADLHRRTGEMQIGWMIVRENPEGECAWVGVRVHRNRPIEVGLDVALFTRTGIGRIVGFACELAKARERRRLTIVIESNATAWCCGTSCAGRWLEAFPSLRWTGCWSMP